MSLFAATLKLEIGSIIMMKRTPPRHLFVLAAMLAFSLAGSVWAQRGSRGGGSLLKVGSDVPELKAFDSKGAAIELRKAVKGKHAVIVFGCLT